ncbi:uncharacterized protein LOC124156337 isoform X2 [Ischnura elegans]|uniref:uncharacterized protein LOC124156337 isoform X2 n=1 Tax=Ischnura elegans TaxID=197161 RepID=UPI001ED8B497|nr:uncharacterized protein LOC124156337 isoform X2 [Ischnura elegans]
MVCCSAPNCSNSSRKGVRLFRFPSDPKRRAVWLINCGRDRWKPSTTSRLCEVHFTEDQFESCRLDGRKLLKQSAVPTLFYFPAHCKASGRKGAPARIGLEGEVHHDPVNLENCPLDESNGKEYFNSSSGGISEPRKQTQIKRQRRKKELKTDDDEVIEFIESLDARKQLPRCVVCSRPLRQNKKEFLSTLTSKTGLSLHQCLIGISVGKSTNIKDCSASDMVCFYCAHLINYADALEAELVKLKNAINGCLEIQNMNEEDQEMLKPEFDSHIVILDEYSERVVGPGSATERRSLIEENQENREPFVMNDVSRIPEYQEPTTFEEGRGNGLSEETSTGGRADTWKKHGKTVESNELLDLQGCSFRKVDPPKFECKICKLRTPSRSVLLFHLRRHMADYQWCDFCDYNLLVDDQEKLSKELAPA